MQPISIVEKEGFREFVDYLEPSYFMPTRFTVKNKSLPLMKKEIENKIIRELDGINSLNIILDGWSNQLKRCFNGYAAQGN